MKTAIATTTADAIRIRGRNLTEELMGQVTYTEMLILTALGRLPTPSEKRIVDAIAVSVMDHGLTPSSLASRLTYLGAPESFQAAVAAGLLGAGSTFLGGMSEVTAMLEVGAADLDDAADDSDVAAAAEHLISTRLDDGLKIPGLGHNVHTGADPRVERMRGLVRAEGCYDKHWRLLDALPDAFERRRHRALPLNNAGAIGACVAALAFPAEMGRGITLAARAGGLIAHLLEEQTQPMAKQVWEHVLREADNSEDGQISNG